MNPNQSKLIIIQGTKERGQYAEDAKWLLFWLIKRLSLSLKDDCVFEFCFDGPRKSIPKEKKERVAFLEPHLKALSKRLGEHLTAHPPPPPDPENVKKKIEEAESWRLDYLTSRKKLAALSPPAPDDGVIDLDDDPHERSEYLRLKWWVEHLEKLERMGIGYKYQLMLAKLLPSGVVGMGTLASECLTGYSILKKRAGSYWETLPQFRQAGIHKVWITHPSSECLLKPDLFVDITRTIGHAAMEISLPIKIDYTLMVPVRLWSRYEGQAGRERAHFER
jgi:hypothetical protein